MKLNLIIAANASLSARAETFFICFAEPVYYIFNLLAKIKASNASVVPSIL